MAVLNDAFSHHPDEGFNLMKAMLLNDGYRFYLDIWSDQPPLLARIFSNVYQHYGNQVHLYRYFVFVFTILSSASFLLVMKRKITPLASCICLLGLACSPEYTAYSVIALVGLPSICFLMLSISFLCASESSKINGLFLLASVTYGLSLATKVWTILVLPAVLLHIYISFPDKRFLYRTALFCLSALSIFIIVTFDSFESINEAISQLFLPHLKRSLSSDLRTFDTIFFSSTLFYLIIGGVFGSLLLLTSSNSFKLPACWLLSSVLAFCVHRPIYDHYIILLQIPAAAVFSGVVINFISILKQNVGSSKNRLLRLLTSLTIIGHFGFYYLLSDKGDSNLPSLVKVDLDALRIAKSLSSPTGKVLTDRPYIAFLLNRPVHPRLAVLSEKRLFTQQLLETDYESIINSEKPELIWLERFDEDLVSEFLPILDKSEYRLIYGISNTRIYYKNT